MFIHWNELRNICAALNNTKDFIIQLFLGIIVNVRTIIGAPHVILKIYKVYPFTIYSIGVDLIYF